MVLSGLVDDNPKSDPDYLLRIAPEPDVEAGPAPPALPAWALGDDQPPAAEEDAAPDEQIVVRRLGLPAAQAVPPPPPPPAAVAPPPMQAPQRAFAARPPAQPDVSVHRVAPKSFNDAQQVADRFKASMPVVLDMEGVESDLAKRLIGFASGLTYGLDGGMERLDGRVFLLIPPGVEIPAAQRARLAAQGSLVG